MHTPWTHTPPTPSRSAPAERVLFVQYLQLFRLNVEGQIGLGEMCVHSRGRKLSIERCPLQPSGQWEWQEVSRRFLFLLTVVEQEPGVIYLHEMTTCLLGIF